MATNDGNLPGMSMSIQLSPDRKPTKKATKSKKKPPETMLFEELLKDPAKKEMILELIKDNKEMIDKYQRRDKEAASSPIDRAKKTISYESPTALIRRRGLEKQKQQKLNFKDTDENDIENVAPVRKKPKKTLLIGVRAFVEVMTFNQNKSEGVKILLQSLGATVVDRLSKSVTHVVYKDGSFETYRTARTLNIPVVSVLWLDVINRTGVRAPEKNYPALGMDCPKNDCDAFCDLQSPFVNRFRKTTNRAIDMDTISEIDDTVETINGNATKLTNLTKENEQIVESTPPRRVTRQSLHARTFADSQNNESPIANTTTGSASINTKNIQKTPGNGRKLSTNNTPKQVQSLTDLRTPIVNSTRRSNKPFSLTPDNENLGCDKRKQTLGNSKSTTNILGTPKPRGILKENSPSSECNKLTKSIELGTRRMTRQSLHSQDTNIQEQTQNSNVDMEITNDKDDNSTRNLIYENTSKASISRRKTNRVTLEMEITSANDNNPINSSDIFIPKTTVPKRKTTSTDSNKPDTQNNKENSKNMSTNTKRTSTSSTRTSTSDNLITYQSKKITRRLSMQLNEQQAKTNKQNMHSGDLSSLNIGNSLVNSNELTSVMDMKKTISSGTDLSLRISTNPSSEMSSLQLSTSNPNEIEESSDQTESTSGSSRKSSLSSIDPHDCVTEMTSEEDDKEIQKSNLTIPKIIKRKSPVFAQDGRFESPNKKKNVRRSSGSPMTKLADKLETTTISNASTKLKKSTDKGNASKQSNTNTHMTSTTGINSTASSRGKRTSVCNPDEGIKEVDEMDADAERREHAIEQNLIRTQNTQHLKQLNTSAPNAIMSNQGDDDDDDAFVELTQCTAETAQRPMQTQQTQKSTQITKKKAKRKYIVCTRFPNKLMTDVKRIVQQLGGCTLDKYVTARTTHLVAMECCQTLKMIDAMCRGTWIVNSDWLFKSGKAGKWDYEDFYEMTEFSPCVKQLRVFKQDNEKAFCHDVFLYCGPIYIAESSHPPKKVLEEFVTLCKGTVVDNKSDAEILIGVPAGDVAESQVSVRELWILDCIQVGRIKKTRPYLMVSDWTFII